LARPIIVDRPSGGVEASLLSGAALASARSPVGAEGSAAGRGKRLPAAHANRGLLAFLRRSPTVASVLVAGLAGVVLVVGWGLGVDPARDVSPGGARIRPLAAACLLLLSLSTWSLGNDSHRSRRRTGIVCAGTVLAASVLVLAEHAFGMDLGVDRVLFPHAIRAMPSGAHPGRVPIDTAAGVGILAAAHLAVLGGASRGLLAGQALALGAGLLGVTGVYSAAYSYSFPGAGTDQPRGLPLSAALALAVLSLGTVAARPASGLTRVMTSDGVGAAMGRRMLAAALTVPFVLGWLPILVRQNGPRFGVAVLITGNAVAFGVVSFVAANAASRLEAVGARAQRAAEEGHAQLMALIDNTSAVIYMRDLDGRYLLVNREYERLFDVRRERVLGQTDHDLFPPEIAAAFRANDLAAVARGTPVQMEEIAPGDDGPHNYITVKFPIFDSTGRPYAVCGISTDITDRTRAEEEVRRLNADLERRVRERTAELEASTRELDAFAYSVSHDLRTPLRSLDGFSQVLLDDYTDRLDDDGKDYLRRLQANTIRMGQMIDDLLDLSRATRVELSRRPVGLAELARSVITELREAEPERNVDVGIADDLTTTGDPHLLRLVLMNLIGNAWKFTARSDPSAIDIGSCGKDGERVFYVRDNGAGFNMEYSAKLFEPFQRLHGRGEFDGSGLGLAIVARILRRHGGRIWAEGAPGQGATFYFTVTPPPEDRR
jgi:PAS domain S-box-containing protein